VTRLKIRLITDGGRSFPQFSAITKKLEKTVSKEGKSGGAMKMNMAKKEAEMSHNYGLDGPIREMKHFDGLGDLHVYAWETRL